MNVTLLIGIILALVAMLFGFHEEGGLITGLLSPSAFMIVFGGTFGAVIASFSLNDVFKAFRALAQSFTKKSKCNPAVVIEKITTIADMCRREGILKIEEAIKDPELDSDEYLFLKGGLIFILDGKDEEEIQYALNSDIKAFTTQKQMEIAVFEGAGGFSPTMGVIGTVMSLVTVLANMGDDATALAHSIATAFIATLYGVGFANILYLPIANKLKNILKRQKLQKEMILDGVCMIARGEASRNIENKLSLYWQAFPGGDKKYKEGITK